VVKFGVKLQAVLHNFSTRSPWAIKAWRNKL